MTKKKHRRSNATRQCEKIFATSAKMRRRENLLVDECECGMRARKIRQQKRNFNDNYFDKFTRKGKKEEEDEEKSVER